MDKPKTYRVQVTLTTGLSYYLKALSKNPDNLDEFVAVTEGGENLKFSREELESYKVTEITREGE